MGTQERNTLDSKPKYEHYFRKDIDVSFGLFSSISMKPIKQEDSTKETLDLEAIQE
jgi:hypothetical protein